MYCHSCGAQLPDGAKFCTACGAAQMADTAGQASEERASTQPRYSSAPAPQPAPAGGLMETMRQMSIRLSVLPLLLGLALMILLFATGGPEVGLGVGGVFAILCAIPMIKALRGSYQKDALELLQAENCFDEAERFYVSTTPMREVYMGRQFVYFQQGRKSVLLRPWDVAWAYHHVTKHYALFIPMGSGHSVMLRTVGGKSYMRPMPKQACQEFLTALKTALPGTVIGYSAQLEHAYKTDRKAFAARWEQTVPGCTAGHTFQ